MRQREDNRWLYDDDFGLSALTERVGASGGSLDEAQVLALAAEVAEVGDGEGAVELGIDARCLLDSALPEDVLRTVWLAASRQRFDPVDHGMDMGGWLRRLTDLYPPRSRKSGHSAWLAPLGPSLDEGELCEALVPEVRASAEALTHAFTQPGAAVLPPESVAAALERVIREGDGELGFRLFLRVLKTHRVPVTKDQYDRLMELGTLLACPGPLVYDGLTVLWPPIDTSRRDATGDFGFSELTSWFSPNRHDRTARETVQRAAANDDTAETPGSAAALLLEDSLRLLESPLSADTITTLWVAASERGFSIDRFSMDGRYWLGLIAEVCGERLREVAPSYTHVAPPVRAELTDAVMRALREVKPLLAEKTVSPHWQGIPGTTVATAVEEVTTRVDPDLGYRLLLRLLHVLSVPLTAEQYARCQALGEAFGYGELHVPLAVEQFVVEESHREVQRVDLYPDVTAADGLVAAITGAAKLSEGEIWRLSGTDTVMIETARGLVSVDPEPQERRFRVRVHIPGFTWDIPGFTWEVGSTDDLGSLVEAVVAWREGVPFDVLAGSTFLEPDGFAGAVERGEPTSAQWATLLSSECHRRQWNLLRRLHADEVLRHMFPTISHGAVRLRVDLFDGESEQVLVHELDAERYEAIRVGAPGAGWAEVPAGDLIAFVRTALGGR